jgi:hypothetical protein
MKPAWEKLENDADVLKMATAVVGDMDCTVHKDTCGKMGVQGYPTIKHGSTDDLQDYSGGRDFDALLAFAKENLGPVCSPANVDLCDDDQKAAIEEAMALSADDLDSKIKEKEEELTAAETNFKDEVAKLQANYEKLTKDKDAALKAVKDSGLGVLKSVKAAKSKESKEEL